MLRRLIVTQHLWSIGILIGMIGVHGLVILTQPAFSIMSPLNLALMTLETALSVALVAWAAWETTKRARRAGAAWTLLTLGICATLVSTVLALTIVSPEAQMRPPTLVDLALLPAHIFFIAGIALLMGRTNARGDAWRIGLEVAVVAIGSLLLYGEFLFAPLIHNRPLTVDVGSAAWSMLYPALDLVIVWMSVALLMRFSRPPLPLALMSLATILFAIGISLFNLPSVRGQIAGSPASAVSSAFLVLALGAVIACSLAQIRAPFLVGMGHEEVTETPRAATHSEAWARVRLVMPHLWIGIAYALLLREQTETDAHPMFFGLSHLQWGTILMIALMLFRQLLALRDSERFSSQRNKLFRLSELLARPNQAAALPALLLTELRALLAYDEAVIVVCGEADTLNVVRLRADQPHHEAIVLAQPAEWLHALIDQDQLPRGELIANWSAGDVPREDVRKLQATLFSGVQAMRSVAVIRLVSQNKAIGLLTIGHSLPAVFSPDQAALLAAFARQTATMIDSAQLRSKERHSAAVNERARLARDLHDSVSQAVFGALLGIKVARETQSSDPESCARRWISESLADAALVEMRALIYELRPETLQREGLIGALQKQVAALCKRHNIEANLITTCDEPPMPIEAKEALYRIALEAVQNTLRHAHARHIDITLSHDRTHLQLEVADDGKGFDTSVRHEGHYGMSTMRERAEQLGAEISIVSAPNRGAKVRVRAPLALAAPSQVPA